MNDDAIRFDGLDEAIIGTDHNGYIVYDHDIMITIFCQQGMTTSEAIEWIDYNVLGTNAGNGFTVLMLNKELTMEDLGDE
ncbi:MAG: hypothetical protein Unbinned4294contig1001_34 [Prokaryotic dsDNA virus sp.]|jgi:hypothetical protein|nr:MAG: hypothetical protein Unbinned4294contig1001_34 [Prokaryotic dsDNA virus sp.]|tara:strand:+ start:679 stop:918 length:240 start_codon:yes stop_codon:yes gene_type:complete